MKKFLAVLAIAGTLVACDNAGSNEQRVKDSTDSAKKADSLKMITPDPVITPDTTMKTTPDTTTKMSGDTTTKM